MAIARRIDNSIPTQSKKIGILLYLFLIPPLISVILALFSLQIKAFFLNLVAFSLFYLALYFSKKGFKAEFEYEISNFAKAPKPYKSIGAFFLLLATFYSAYLLSGLSLMQSLFLGVVAFVGYWLWYGLDPTKDKIPDIGDMGSEVAFKTLSEAKEKLRHIQELVPKIKNPDLRHRMEQSVDRAWQIMKELDKKPGYVRELRKFLVVFVDSLGEVTQSYVKSQEEVSEEVKRAFYDLLADVERRFEKELERVRSIDVEELDTKMKTLDKQIKEL